MAAYEYRFKKGSVHKVSAEVAGRVCQELSDTPEGLTPKRLVDASRAPDAPMHNEFEWDDTVAGEKYREEQARKVIQHIVVVTTNSDNVRKVRLELATQPGEQAEGFSEESDNNEEETQDRAYVSTGERTTKYVPIVCALSNEEWRKNLLSAARKDIEIFINKYHRLKELANIIDDMNRFLGA